MPNRTLPDGFRLIDLEVNENRSLTGLKMCLILVPSTEKAGARAPMRLRTLPDASVYLGALVDSRRNLHDYFEIWVQSVSGFCDQYPNTHYRHTNSDLDRLWESRFEQFAELDPGNTFSTCYEGMAFGPVFFDETFEQIRDMPELSGWTLCTDDTILESSGRPAYSQSLARYLYRASAGPEDEYEFYNLSENDGHSASVQEVLIEAMRGAFVFNREGGRIGLRRHPELGYQDYLGLVAGTGTRGARSFGEGFITDDETKGTDDSRITRGFLFSHLGFDARLAEVFYLNLALVRDLVGIVSEKTRLSSKPLLNLKPESLGVILSKTSTSLPFLWSRDLILLNPGDALPIPVPGSDDEAFFVSGSYSASSVYWPGERSIIITGTGTIRIRHVHENRSKSGNRSFSIEGTLVTHENLRAAKRDILHLRLPVGDRNLEVYATAVETTNVTSEYRFRSIEQEQPHFEELLSGSDILLRQFPRSSFTLIPVEGSPSDLYACGVIALQTFFAASTRSLPQLVDDAHTLVAELSAAGKVQKGAHGERLHQWVDRDRTERWRKTFGMRNLLSEEIPFKSADGIPEELWWDVLALILRFFPGNSAWSFCEDLSDFQATAPANIYQVPLAELTLLCDQARSLVTGSWVSNREISRAVSERLKNAG